MILEALQNTLRETFPGLNINASIDGRNIVTLNGECETWDQVVKAGHMAAKPAEVKNVVNELSVRGKPTPRKDYGPWREAGLRIGHIDSVDVLIIGAGISGCGIARELSKYRLNTLVVEQGDDVAAGATKANNGNIHPGHSVHPGTLKARLNVEGN
ncbi:MAG: FAD-dependent oxidoreductase, partial [Treponema sp.]|nr:FAD-dependent oxidoreductase [Treponema sp.]